MRTTGVASLRDDASKAEQRASTIPHKMYIICRWGGIARSLCDDASKAEKHLDHPP